MNCHVVLAGLPGAGKSSVGRLVAQTMNVELLDIDELIERREGSTIAEIIRDRGEPEFRRLEKSQTERAFVEPFAVIAPGGGWAAEADNLDNLPEQALSVYLKTSPQAAAVRVSGSSDRPLLNGPDLLAQLKDLLAIRQSFYEQCEATVSTDGKTVREVAEEVVELARRATGG